MNETVWQIVAYLVSVGGVIGVLYYNYRRDTAERRAFEKSIEIKKRVIEVKFEDTLDEVCQNCLYYRHKYRECDACKKPEKGKCSHHVDKD